MSKVNFMESAMNLVEQELTKKRGGSGRHTYLDRFVSALTDEDGNPTEGKTRNELTAEIALEIAQEQRVAAQAEDDTIEDLSFENEDDKALFLAIAKKVKPMVAAAISNSQNATSLSYNEKYKTTWEVVKDGAQVSLRAIG